MKNAFVHPKRAISGAPTNGKMPAPSSVTPKISDCTRAVIATGNQSPISLAQAGYKGAGKPQTRRVLR